MLRKRLLLVFQREGKSAHLVIGMSVHEYCAVETGKMTKSYIQYIDTTGMYRPRECQSRLTRSLVQTYIMYCRQILRVQSVHLMASSKPSFLFAGSEFMATKGKLSTAKLVKWWLSVVEDAHAKVESPVQISLWSPGEDLVEDDRTKERVERRGRQGNKNNSWSYGPFYKPGDKLVDVVPLFEDDPMLKHFQSFYEDCKMDKQKVEALKAKTFMETLGLRPEFRNQCHSTFFVVEYPDNKDKGLQNLTSKDAKPTQLASFAAKMLGNLTFEDEAKCLDASSKITSWLKFMGSKPVEITCDVPPSDNDVSKRKLEAPKDTENASPNNLQGLIKKRRIDQSE